MKMLVKLQIATILYFHTFFDILMTFTKSQNKRKCVAIRYKLENKMPHNKAVIQGILIVEISNCEL